MLSSIFALALLPLSALSLTVNNPSTTVTSGGNITITWTTTTGDPSTFHIELSNTVFNSQFAVAASVNASAESLTVQLPEVVPGSFPVYRSGFAIQFVNIANISQVYAQTSQFSIANAASGTASTGAASTATGISTGPLSASTGSATSTRPASASGSSASSSSSSASTTSNAASTLQIGGAGIVAAVLGWVVAI
ncbi:hypothetical protein IW261DRAFT_1533216 [Armillaria novae-zelandiae]|uniref:Yeast cell wall synthesis Kre9/Knh1-like N-terminal domain-containing protein n=1 Tax=Armillaria novae-zelandiae TaxID=153914 RepID=A0AA39TNC7_9AGAR|nr:hypothetical protein IW261DRAFT_1533216 [Armillaria novae-zelandiae]